MLGQRLPSPPPEGGDEEEQYSLEDLPEEIILGKHAMPPLGTAKPRQRSCTPSAPCGCFFSFLTGRPPLPELGGHLSMSQVIAAANKPNDMLQLPKLPRQFVCPSPEQLFKRKKPALHDLTDRISVQPCLSPETAPPLITAIGKAPTELQNADTTLVHQNTLKMLDSTLLQHVKVARQAVLHICGSGEVAELVRKMLKDTDSDYDIPTSFRIQHLTAVKNMRQIENDGLLGTPFQGTGAKGDAFPVCFVTAWKQLHQFGQDVPSKVRPHPFYAAAVSGTLGAEVDRVVAEFGSDQSACWAMRLFTLRT